MNKLVILNGKNDKINSETVVVIGNFDGIHLGHIAVINAMKTLAKKMNLSSVVFSFFPHPIALVSKKTDFKTLLTQTEKAKELENQNVDFFRNYPTTLEFLEQSPHFFVEQVLKNELNAKYVIVGEDFKFGKNRSSNFVDLVNICESHGITAKKILHINSKNDEKISTTKIKNFISNGDFESAKNLLGKNFYLFGKVVEGKKLGRTIGVPTANVVPESEKFLPKNGVYITKTTVANKIFNSITNIGINPTFSQNKVIAETFIFDFDEEIYGEEIKVEILGFVRPEFKFSGVEELKEQMHKDIMYVKKYFKKFEKGGA